MGGLTREERLPQPQETRMCVLRLLLTLHVPEEETTATGPSQTPADVLGQTVWLCPVLRSPGDTAVTFAAPRLRRSQLCVQRVTESCPGVPCEFWDSRCAICLWLCVALRMLVQLTLLCPLSHLLRPSLRWLLFSAELEDMPTVASPLPLTTVGSENSSSIYDYDYLDDMTILVCRKDEVLSFGRVFLPVVYSLIFVLGLAGNLLLLVVLLHSAPRRRTMELYLLNLAVSNLLFVVTMPFWAISVAWHWVFGSFLCKVISTLYSINFYCGIFFITCMSLDKYLEIVHAQPLHSPKAQFRNLLLIVMVWITSLAISVPEMVFVQIHQTLDGVWHCYADFGGHATIWKLYLRFQLNLLGFLLPLLAMIFFYSRIGCVLVRLRPPGQGRALRMAAALVIVFFMLWFPYNLTLFLHSLLDLHVFGNCEISHRLDYTLQVTESLTFSHCCFTPVLYAFCSHRFRQYLKAFLSVMLRWHQAPGTTHAPSSNHSESSRVTAQEDVVSMNDLGERQSEDSLNKGEMGNT